VRIGSKERWWISILVTAALSPVYLLYVHALPSNTKINNTRKDDAIEAAIRHRVKRWPTIHFVSLDGKDPDDKFMARLSDLQGLVRKNSHSVRDSGGMQKLGHIDRLSRQQGQPLRISKLTWQGPFKAELTMGYLWSGDTLILQKLGPRWFVIGHKDRWED
jgi:hypothetical protein